MLSGIIPNSYVFSQTSLSRLNNTSEFEEFMGLPLSEKYGQVSAVKVVYDLYTQHIHFINSKYFKYHHEFCSRVLNYETELSYFNETNYTDNPHRKFLLANINHFKSLGIYVLELSPVDEMNVEQIRELFLAVSHTVYFSKELKFLLNSSRLIELTDSIERYIPVINPSDLYSNIDYQAISKHTGYGILKYIDNLETQQNEITPIDIIVLKETPVYLPRVAGIIVTEFQTPLSHLTILGQNRKIPIAACKTAFENPVLRSFEEQKICLTVQSDTIKITSINSLNQTGIHNKKVKLKSDLSKHGLIDVKDLKNNSYAYAGNKASNFGILYKLSKKGGFKVPESAFAIPFYYYNEHLKRSNCQPFINDLLQNSDPDSVAFYLKSIRKQILQTPIDSTLLKEIQNKIKSLGKYTSLRFRSSTNAEDAKGFSGAGLYTSKTGIVDHPEKTIEKAIKQVWASLWSYEAYSEREYFEIDHREVYMGILAHRSFPDEAVNGVAITKNLYRENNYGFVINAQLGDESVVKPKTGQVCDQFVCYPDNTGTIYSDKNPIDIITLSNLNNNSLVMSDSEIQLLANQLERIKKYFFSHSLTQKKYLEFGLDIEFKLDKPDRTLYIKQVRLFND